MLCHLAAKSVLVRAESDQLTIGRATARTADAPERIFHRKSTSPQIPQLATVEEAVTPRKILASLSRREARAASLAQYRQFKSAVSKDCQTALRRFSEFAMAMSYFPLTSWSCAAALAARTSEGLATFSGTATCLDPHAGPQTRLRSGRSLPPSHNQRGRRSPRPDRSGPDTLRRWVAGPLRPNCPAWPSSLELPRLSQRNTNDPPQGPLTTRTSRTPRRRQQSATSPLPGGSPLPVGIICLAQSPSKLPTSIPARFSASHPNWQETVAPR